MSYLLIFCFYYDYVRINVIPVTFVELCKEGIEKGWKKFNFASVFTPQIDQIMDNISRIDGKNITAEQFISDYEAHYKPCVITNLQNTWPANESWTKKVAADRSTAQSSPAFSAAKYRRVFLISDLCTGVT